MAERNSKLNRRVIAADKVSRRVIASYKDYITAADALGLGHKYAFQSVEYRRVPRDGMFFLRYEDEFDPHEEFTGYRAMPIYMAKNGRLRCFYTTHEAEAATGIGRRVLCRYVRDGEGLGFKWGKVTKGVDALIEELGGKRDG